MPITISGSAFESRTDVFKMLGEAGFVINDNIASNGIYSLESYPQGEFISWLESEFGITYNEDGRVQTRYRPDDAIVCRQTCVITIVEKKTQSTGGSVDEKIGGAPFKKEEYERLVAGTGFKVQVIYLLDEWFESPKYNNVVDYIRRNGVEIYFRTFPVEILLRSLD